ncbi:hypothetical protein MKK70_26925 [Methylobacterium sp. E-041]|jgi:hypothetical protein|uniref:hypothetical protein n=1 Tax=unclassified Methylobacterium TaxID=2615210 RepID=UPI001FBA23D5|nr:MULTISPECIES: hypothetical protein [unclassified Methylobacterium]MCJ2108938.1 hypothetical protein [Methylobacterium sp. E-041]MCJ2110261.1 hypothetical protein [Methylobacterium sp. E-025]
MRNVVVALLVVVAAPANAVEPVKDEAVAIGPWKVEAIAKGQKFERCTMTRTTDDGVEVRFARDSDGLDLSMSSPKWKLGKGKNYPVELAAGTSILKAEVAATGNVVSLPIKDERFLKSLRLGDALEVRGEGSTIQVALDKSAAGLDRLEGCYGKNLAPAETNPFVAPSRKP